MPLWSLVVWQGSFFYHEKRSLHIREARHRVSHAAGKTFHGLAPSSQASRGLSGTRSSGVHVGLPNQKKQTSPFKKDPPSKILCDGRTELVCRLFAQNTERVLLTLRQRRPPLSRARRAGPNLPTLTLYSPKPIRSGRRASQDRATTTGTWAPSASEAATKSWGTGSSTVRGFLWDVLSRRAGVRPQCGNSSVSRVSRNWIAVQSVSVSDHQLGSDAKMISRRLRLLVFRRLTMS